MHHMIAFFGGFLLDLLLGDPHCFPHPIRFIGKLINITEKKLHKPKKEKKKAEFWQGILLVNIVLISVMTSVTFLLFLAYHIHFYIGISLECIMTYQILAIKCLKVESMKVYQCLKKGNLKQAQIAVSMIVGRDTECLNEEGVAKATVETVAENTCDGIIAPMFYLAIGGPILGFFYKTVNTMDSMLGYKNDKYFYFGRAAAKLDDFVNFIPARISACCLLVASFLTGNHFINAYTIYKRDCKKHASPNAGQTEAVCAGALGVQLAGDASYFGKKVKKPYIGDALRNIEHTDIKRVNRLMYTSAGLFEGICLLVMYLIERCL